jgi:hypothetical protein
LLFLDQNKTGPPRPVFKVYSALQFISTGRSASLPSRQISYAAERSILDMNEIGQLLEADGRYEFRHSALGLIVRGDHPEWVLQAAGEVIANTAKLEAESLIDELSTLLEFEEAEAIEVDAVKYAVQERFEIVPQCLVTVGKMDYKWASPEGREQLAAEYSGHTVRRVHDMSLTHTDSFLKNEPGVDTSDH